MERFEDLRNQITGTLIRDGTFVNYVDKDLLEDTIGKVCSIEDVTFIRGVLLAMKMDLFYPIKVLIPLINSQAHQKELLSVFIETLKTRFKLGVNWRILLAPIKYNEKQNKHYLFDIQKYYGDMRFVNICCSEGIKILNIAMLYKDLISPIELPINDGLELYSKRVVKLWFMPLNREAFLTSLRQAISVFEGNIGNNAIKRSAIAQLLFLIFESYDYHRTLDITESITPYCVFKNVLKEKKTEVEEKRISRTLLRKYVTYAFIKLMGNNEVPRKELMPGFNIVQQKLKELLENMKLAKVNEFLKEEVKVYF